MRVYFTDDSVFGILIVAVSNRQLNRLSANIDSRLYGKIWIRNIGISKLRSGNGDISWSPHKAWQYIGKSITCVDPKVEICWMKQVHSRNLLNWKSADLGSVGRFFTQNLRDQHENNQTLHYRGQLDVVANRRPS